MRGLSRVGGEHAVWHVMNRAAQRVEIFSSDSDYLFFLGLLKKFTTKRGLKVAAYCIMSNHYHVLVKGKGEDLTPCFHEVDRQYAVRCNERSQGRGHVFQGPFLSFHQRTGGWAVRTSAYIHLNPVGQRYPQPEDYPWSSYSSYLNSENTWLNPEIILAVLRPDLAEARQVYADLVEVRIPWNPLMGRLPEERRFQSSVAMELGALVDRLSSDLDVSESEATRLVAYYGRTYLGLPLATLAQALSVDSPAALKMQLSRVRARLKSPEYRAWIERVEYLLDQAPTMPVTNQTL